MSCEAHDRRTIGGIPLHDVSIEQIECSPRTSVLHDVSLMRALDRYLRLDDMALTIISEDGNGRPFSTDASGMIGASMSVQDSMGFVESRIGSVGMFTMHGTWQDMLDVLLIHVSGKGRIVVVTPSGAKPVMRRSLARDIRRAVRLAEGYMF